MVPPEAIRCDERAFRILFCRFVGGKINDFCIRNGWDIHTHTHTLPDTCARRMNQLNLYETPRHSPCPVRARITIFFFLKFLQRTKPKRQKKKKGIESGGRWRDNKWIACASPILLLLYVADTYATTATIPLYVRGRIIKGIMPMESPHCSHVCTFIDRF